MIKIGNKVRIDLEILAGNIASDDVGFIIEDVFPVDVYKLITKKNASYKVVEVIQRRKQTEYILELSPELRVTMRDNEIIKEDY